MTWPRSKRLHSFDLCLARIEVRLGEPMSQADRLIMPTNSGARPSPDALDSDEFSFSLTKVRLPIVSTFGSRKPDRSAAFRMILSGDRQRPIPTLVPFAPPKRQALGDIRSSQHPLTKLPSLVVMRGAGRIPEVERVRLALSLGEFPQFPV